MYVRRPNRDPNPPPHLPEHYSGWAFRPPPPPGDRPPGGQSNVQGPVPQKPPLDPPKSPFLPRPFPPLLPPPGDRPDPAPPDHGSGPDRPDGPSLPPFHALFKGASSIRSGTFSFEELLLIGLIFLLGRDGDGGNGDAASNASGDSELPLLLALLLFCG